MNAELLAFGLLSLATGIAVLVGARQLYQIGRAHV